MFYVELLFVLVLALLVSAAFTIGRLGGGPWPGAVWFFLVLFFGTFALGVWLRPVGPTFWGARLVPYIIAAGAISLLLAAATTAGRAPADRGGSEAPRRVAMGVAAWAFFWATILLSATAIALHYLVT
jgi:hypothetical protein